MPQMKPLLWMWLFFNMVMLLLLFIILIYFIYIKDKMISEKLKNSNPMMFKNSW